ncbi:MAG: hypothetical protein RBS80_11310 [Thermoguttaceae bacterium]|nr:hypothetical protein [Thermoguttaceae bacterium]
MRSPSYIPAWLLATVVVFGCGTAPPEEADERGPEPSAGSPADVAPTEPAARGSQEESAPTPVTEEGLRAALKRANPGLGDEVGVAGDGRAILAVEAHDRNLKDITPLRGLPLVALDLARTAVEDLEPLRGMPLRELYLEDTPVNDLGPLKGAPLEKLYLSQTKVADLGALETAVHLKELNLVDAKVSDLSPLAGLPQLEMLWLTGCPVENIASLARVRSLVSLTLEKTKVKDLSPLEGHPLLRLHIGETPITDLTPLRSMHLTRLIFTPGRIEKGIEHARNMRTLRELGTEFSDPRVRPPMPPSEFWAKYDAGAL